MISVDTHPSIFFSFVYSHCWVKNMEKEIQQHAEWKENIISEKEAEKVLQGSQGLRFLIWKDPTKQFTYWISYLTKDLRIHHRFFVLESDEKYLFYKHANPYRQKTLRSLLAEVIS